MKIILSIIVIGLFLTSCKKETYQHSEEGKLPEHCVCSKVQDSIPGTYTGTLRVYDEITYDLILDTIITIDVTRIWFNSYQDSVECLYSIPYFFSEPVSFTSNSTAIPGGQYDVQAFFASDNVIGAPYFLRIQNSDIINTWISQDTYSFWGIRQ